MGASSAPYYYVPSLEAAIIFVVLFMAATILHAYQMWQTKTWFLTAFCCGGFFEAAGYIVRAKSATESGIPRYEIGPFVAQNMLLLVAPALFAASIYMELGRISEALRADTYLLVRRQRLTGTFVTGDVIAFFSQLGGSGLMASDSNSVRNIGRIIAIVGLVVQIVFFSCFIVAGVMFHRRLRKKPTQRLLEQPQALRYERHMHAIYGTSVLIFARSIVRVVEFVQGLEGYIATHQIFIFVFDAVPMFVVMLILNWIHPSEIRSLVNGGKMAKWVRLIECAPVSS
ncbi:RTA1 domain-containing protein [Aspergillus lucknowensis]|uniref:RTA1 like protein-domain-containing protein n=1 Tax=Aspergillus lucknowensis TaxID=176173 RepID=A0ABR4LP87_9EURO